jgi:hypothetical protein
MVAAILLTVSVVAFGQFALYYWRATISGVASQEISARIMVAARLASPSVGAGDFKSILMLNHLSPDLRGPNSSFRTVRAYYSIVKTLGKLVPAAASWANIEMTTCARYVAVVMGQHLDRNLECAAQMRGI